MADDRVRAHARTSSASGRAAPAWLDGRGHLVSFGSVAITFLWGWTRGGSAYDAYYQLWRFLLALLFALLLLASVVRGPRDLKAVGLTLVAAAVVRAILAIYFYWVSSAGSSSIRRPCT